MKDETKSKARSRKQQPTFVSGLNEHEQEFNDCSCSFGVRRLGRGHLARLVIHYRQAGALGRSQPGLSSELVRRRIHRRSTYSSSLLACSCIGVGGPDGRILVARLHFWRYWRIVAFGFGDCLAAIFASKSVRSFPWWADRHADS